MTESVIFNYEGEEYYRFCMDLLIFLESRPFSETLVDICEDASRVITWWNSEAKSLVQSLINPK